MAAALPLFNRIIHRVFKTGLGMLVTRSAGRVAIAEVVRQSSSQPTAILIERRVVITVHHFGEMEAKNSASLWATCAPLAALACASLAYLYISRRRNKSSTTADDRESNAVGTDDAR